MYVPLEVASTLSHTGVLSVFQIECPVLRGLIWVRVGECGILVCILILRDILDCNHGISHITAVTSNVGLKSREEVLLGTQSDEEVIYWITVG